MNLSHHQFAFLERSKRADFEARLAKFLRGQFQTAGSLTDEKLAEEIRAAVRKARQFDISSEAGVVQWACLTFSVGPHFRAIPALNAYFMASAGDDEYLLRTLLNVTLQLCGDPNPTPTADARTDALRHLAACSLFTELSPAARSSLAEALPVAFDSFSSAIVGARAREASVDSLRFGVKTPLPVSPYASEYRHVKMRIEAIEESISDWSQGQTFDQEIAVAGSTGVINAAKEETPWVSAAASIAAGMLVGRVLDALDDRVQLTGKIAENISSMKRAASTWLTPGGKVDSLGTAQFRPVSEDSDADETFASELLAFPLARAFARRGQFLAAIRCCKELLQQDSKDAFSILMLAGDCFLALGSLKPAERLYRQARTIDGSSATALAALSQVHGLGEGRGEAETEMRAAVNLAPGEPYAYVVAGNLQLGGDNPVQAIEYYKYALKLNSMFVPAYAPLMAAFMANGSMEDAAKVAQLTIKRAPDDVSCLLVAGQILEMEGKFEEAAQHAARAVQQSPENFRCHLALARAEISWNHDLLKSEFHLRLASQLAGPGKIQRAIRQLHDELTDYLSLQPV